MIKRILLAFAMLVVGLGQPVTQLSAPAQATAVTQINVTSAITSLTRTSTSGVTPMTWSVGLSSAVHEGYYLRLSVYADGGKATLIKTTRHYITKEDLQPGAVLDLATDGYNPPTATQWLEVSVEATSPHGKFFSYAYPTLLTPTDAVAAMVWNAADKTAGISLSNGNLTASQFSAPGGVRTNRGISTGKVYWEIHLDTGACQVNLYDLTASLTVDQEIGFNGGTPSVHAAVYPPTNGYANFNTNFFAVTNMAAGDTIGVAYDATNNLLWWAKNNTWQNSGNPAAGTGGLSTSGIGATVYPAVNMQNGIVATLNAGTTPGGTAGFTYTPPAGFVAP